jgi:uncharacterized repeat protein (TIGR01451 family)
VISYFRSRTTSSSKRKETGDVIPPGTWLPVKLMVAGALLLAISLTAVPAASAAGPAWAIEVSHEPAIFHRGEVRSEAIHDVYRVAITNTGDARTSGPITITDTLPAGLTISPPTFNGEQSGSFEFSECTGDGKVPIDDASVLSCSMVSERMEPGETRVIRVIVSVSESAPDLAVNTASVSGGGAAASATAQDPTTIGDKLPYEINNFISPTTDKGGANYTLAGGHPHQSLTTFGFSLDDGGFPVEYLKDADVDIPNGFFGNPAAAPRCDLSKVPSFEFVPGSICPLGSAVGTARLNSNGAAPLYNVKPERGHPAQFAFNIFGTIISLVATPRPRTESYGLTIGSSSVARLPTSSSIRSFTTVFNGFVSNGTEAPFLTNPVDCSDTNPTWRVVSDSWENPGRLTALGVPDLGDPRWLTKTIPAPPVTGCDDPALVSQFRPAVGTTPVQGGGAVQADQPSGLAVDLDFPQSNDPTDLNTTFEPSKPQAPEPKNITVKLPGGLSVSPSSASGLNGCSDLASDPAGDQVNYDSIKPANCPDASKIGTVTATTPLLASHDPVTDAVSGAEPIGGNVYLLTPHPGDLNVGGNRDGTFRLLIELNSPRYGINFKLPGTAVADKNTGQLTTVFTDNPQLPAKHLTVNLKSGPRAPLATPTTCGSFETASRFVPWGSPTIPDAVPPNATFNVGSGPNGSPCAATPAARPFAPALSAGTTSSKAGAPSPFVMRLTRNDGEQELSSLSVLTPKGFTAKLAGVSYCPEAAIAAASGKSGASEQGSASCPAASQVGTITAGSGPGSNPYYVNGKAYLSGPYKGAPLSLAFITPAVAGPFDLGNVVVRAALAVDPETAQVTVKTDPLPQIIDGVPLRLRSIVAKIDRPNFTLNPTNCSPMSVNATVIGASGASASPSSAFQVGSCKDLGFKPDLKLSLKGGTGRSDHPALKATLTYPKGNYANIAKAVVSLPHSEFLAQNHIKTICTRVQFAADQCPAASVYGAVTATTPLLDQPLSGPLYLRSSSHPLPDLVAALHGQIDIDLVGRIDSKNGGIRTTFDSVPDAPVSRFVLSMQGGKKGLLENSKNLCASINRADVKFTAQNGKAANSTPVLTNSCKKKHAKGAKGKDHKRTFSGWIFSLGF